MKRFHRALIPALLALMPLAAGAQLKLLPPCTEKGNCSISDILVVFGNLAEFLLGIVGAVALVYFVYGGFVFVLSRGNKGDVDKAFGILRSASIGIFIIFLSGVFVRFTLTALTGGSSQVPTVGETCIPGDPARSDPAGDGLWVLMPAGVRNDGSVIPQGLYCLKKEKGAKKAGDDCTELNNALKERGREERYNCIDVNTATTSCVRGLCSELPAQFACCRKP